MPSQIRAAFQPSEPSAVHSKKRPSRIRSVPAGIDTALRRPGTNRASSTIMSPRRANHASVRARRFSVTPRNRGSRSARDRPPIRPTVYSSQAPSTEPSVAASAAAQKASCPAETCRPTTGRTSSDGTGGSTFSTSMTAASPA